jgi:biotin carboxyl carrier protein
VPADRRQRPAGQGKADPQRAARTAADRAADHAAIDRLADDLVPALIAKLAASGLGEIEIGEETWTIRVRRSADGSAGQSRRASDRASRSQPGHAGHGHAPGGFEGHRSVRDAKPMAGAVAASTNGAGAGAGAPTDAPVAGGQRAPDAPADPHRVVATSPAVGVFQPRVDMKPGTRVRHGERLGAVDMLGIPQEVVAPADGILGASLVEAGQAVEYGQDLIIIELAARAAERSEA